MALTHLQLVYATQSLVSVHALNTWLVFSATNARLAIGILLAEKDASHVAVIRKVHWKLSATRYDLFVT